MRDVIVSRMARAERLWCTTCGEYVAPGSHGIHESVYGRGPTAASPREMNSALAVVMVVTGVVGAVAGAAALLWLIFWS